jgi:hypothetical protein
MGNYIKTLFCNIKKITVFDKNGKTILRIRKAQTN